MSTINKSNSPAATCNIQIRYNNISNRDLVRPNLFHNKKDYLFGQACPFSLDRLIDTLSQKLKGKKITLLDVGCGHGLVISALRGKSPNLEVEGLDARPYPSVIQEDAHEIAESKKLEGKNYDLIVSAGMVRNLVHPLFFVEQAYKKLNKGGFLILDSLLIQGLGEEEDGLIQRLKKDGHQVFAETVEKTDFDNVNYSLFMMKKTKNDLKFPVAFFIDTSTAVPASLKTLSYEFKEKIDEALPDLISENEYKQKVSDFFDVEDLFPPLELEEKKSC